MTPDEAGRLRIVKLGGFGKAILNEEYLEGPTQNFTISGRETYWQASGQYFMYFCKRYTKWRIASISGFSSVRNGDCVAYASDGIPGRDILDPELIKGWIEVEDANWVQRVNAGVVHIGTIEQQLLGIGAQPEEGQCENDPDAPEEELPFSADGKSKKRTSKCPVKWVANKVMDGVAEVGKWMRRLFPALLGAPPEKTE